MTPSLVIFGAPKDWSSTALRPFGPSVAETASARVWSRLGLCLLRENDNKFTEEIVGCFAHARALRPGVALHHARLGEVRLPSR